LDLYLRKMGWLLGPELSELILPWHVYYGCGNGFRTVAMSVGKCYGKFQRDQSLLLLATLVVESLWVFRWLGNPTTMEH
jgi:hypothetical protein